MCPVTLRVRLCDELQFMRSEDRQPDRSCAFVHQGHRIMAPDPTESVRDIDDGTDVANLREPSS
jgi:hypothetical protein